MRYVPMTYRYNERLWWGIADLHDLSYRVGPCSQAQQPGSEHRMAIAAQLFNAGSSPTSRTPMLGRRWEPRL